MPVGLSIMLVVSVEGTTVCYSVSLTMRPNRAFSYKLHSTESDIPVSNEYVGSYAAVDGNGVPVTITIEEGDVNYYYCLQDMFRFKNPVAFPALARFQPEGFEWMTSEQETVSNILGWACVAVLFVVAVIFINRILIRFLRNQFSSPYKVRSKIENVLIARLFCFQQTCCC